MPDLAANIRLKRVYDEPSPDDGRRILITRYWPRGVRRDAVDEYTTKVAPSRGLLREFKHEGLNLGGVRAPISQRDEATGRSDGNRAIG